jgi:hypothetical protein
VPLHFVGIGGSAAHQCEYFITANAQRGAQS